MYHHFFPFQVPPQPSQSPLQGHHPHHPGSNTSSQQSAAVNAQKYLLSSYRVAMLALDNLGRRINEDRPQAKFAKTPSYAEDVKWLHSIAQKLGKIRFS